MDGKHSTPKNKVLKYLNVAEDERFKLSPEVNPGQVSNLLQRINFADLPRSKMLNKRLCEVI